MEEPQHARGGARVGMASLLIAATTSQRGHPPACGRPFVCIAGNQTWGAGAEAGRPADPPLSRHVRVEQAVLTGGARLLGQPCLPRMAPRRRPRARPTGKLSSGRNTSWVRAGLRFGRHPGHIGIITPVRRQAAGRGCVRDRAQGEEPGDREESVHRQRPRRRRLPTGHPAPLAQATQSSSSTRSR